MRPALFRPIIIIFIITLSGTLSAQNCFNTGLNGTVINLPCNQNCVNIPVKIPHLKSTTDYALNTIAYNPYPFTSPSGNEVPPTVYADDNYSPAIDIPFSVCFYDSIYSQFVIGSNGLITFDIANSDCDNAWTISQQLPFSGGTICALPGPYYPKAAIMGAFSDLDPRIAGTVASPPDRKIEWRVEGTAPCRKLIVSYYHVGVYGNNPCGLATPNTFQMVMYESTGIIEVFFEQKACASNTNLGRAILGIQNWDRDKAVAAPGKNNTVWNEVNTGYRFTPSGGASRFVSCQVFNLAGTLIATGDTATTVQGELDVTFPTFCPTGSTGQYVVKTTFVACDNPANEITSLDTITINKTNGLDATVVTTPTSCGISGTGTATITVPSGVGVQPFTYVLTPGNVTFTGNGPHQFTNLTAGNYTVVVSDGGDVCTSTLNFPIVSTGTLAVTYTVTNTSCAGPSNGSIVVNPPNGTPPFTYSINGGPFTGNNTFSNLAPATYLVSTHDAAGCEANNQSVTVNPGPPITFNAVATPTSCPGANNGSITLTASGTAPHQFAINGGPYQSSNTFTGLQGGVTYYIDIRDAVGCILTFQAVQVPQGTGTLTGTANPTSPSCTGATDGSITVTPTSGSGPYTYSLNGGAYQSSNVFSGLTSGTYSILIKEAGLCTSAPIAVTIAAGVALTGTATFTPTSCPGVNNGTITATPSGSNPGPFTYALDGGTPQAGSTFTGVNAGSHNIVIRTASGCVSANIPVTVTAGAGLTANISSTPTTCTGITNGSISVTPTSGTAPYVFVLNGTTTLTGATANFTAVGAGPHTVTVTDAIGCSTTTPLSTTVAAGAGFTATYTSVNSSCTGANNGSITVTTGTGGAGPYSFVLGSTTQTGASSSTFNNVTAGTYSILITDANGCQFNLQNVIVNPNTGFTATYTATNSSCTGATNGSLTVTPGAGGAEPYTFVLGSTTQTGATSTTFNNIASGTYSVLITDASGCQFTLTNAVVNPNTGFTATYTSTNTSCVGAANGSLTVTPGTGGAGPYTFLLGTASQTGATSTTFSGLAAGSYSVLVTDANGCQFTLNSATVNPGPALTANVTPIATACPGVSNGGVVVTPGNGNGPYTFVLNGTLTQTGATSTTFTGVAAGSHSVVITDANGCSASPPAVTVASGTGITANVNPVSTSCTGATNGSIVITPNNGTGPFTFVLNGTISQTGASSTTFGGLAAGNSYSIAVTDAIGCSGSFSNISVPQGSVLLANAVPGTTTCSNAANGQIVVTPTNGAGPFTFVLNGTTTQTGATNTTFTNLIANTYSIVVTDGAGCISSPISSIVVAGPPITVTPTKTDATCFGASTGSITAAASSNATAPIEYSLDNTTWQSSPNFTGLPAASYTVYIRDNVGCTNTASISVGQPSQLAATPGVQNVLCNGQSNGVITVTASGGTGPYTYSLTNTTYQPGNTFQVPSGSYTVYVKDANNCIIQLNNVGVTQPGVLTATAVRGNATCDGGNDGTITVTSAGGTAPYQYAISGGTYQLSNVLNAAPGTYNVSVKDANGCTFTITGNVVGLTNNLTLTPAVDPAAICEGTTTSLRLNTNATQFLWAADPSLSSTTVSSPDAKPTVTTLYSVVVTLGRCSAQDDILVSVMPAPIPDAGLGDTICFGQTYYLNAVGDPTYTYNWSPSTYLDVANGFNPLVTPDKSITYTLSVTDANGCTSLVTDQVTVTVTPPIQVTTWPVDTVVFAGATVPLLATSAGTSYLWSPATGLDNPNIPNPVATAPSVDGQIVTYQVITTTSAGCQGEAYVTITVYKGPDIYVANAFTPNGDGRNETFVPFPVGIKQLNYFRVYNRWGNLMFSTTTLNNGWDGRFGGMEQPTGIYVWMAEGITMDNKKITKKGTVMLVR
ncbi:MAG: gliding motility-associated C-terminal domain-containing protein [Chitinophagaceae bacterium]|nr:gliding motility-associated C-terminal domain-containing protein [Chitinophagaceae bacterium]